jgi:hypothetical protein
VGALKLVGILYFNAAHHINYYNSSNVVDRKVFGMLTETF